MRRELVATEKMKEEMEETSLR